MGRAAWGLKLDSFCCLFEVRWGGADSIVALYEGQSGPSVTVSEGSLGGKALPRGTCGLRNSSESWGARYQTSTLAHVSEKRPLED